MAYQDQIKSSKALSESLMPCLIGMLDLIEGGVTPFKASAFAVDEFHTDRSCRNP